MEMRRCARRNLVSNGTGSHTDAVPRGFAEPGILTAYWLISRTPDIGIKIMQGWA